MSPLPIGVYEKALPQALSWEQRLLTAREAGFDFVELSIDESEQRLGRLQHCQERADIKAALAATGVPLKTMCLSGHRKYPLGSSALVTRDKADELLARALELAVELGIRIIQLAGYYVYYEQETEQSVRYYEAGLARGLELASQAGVMLAIENMDTLGVTSLSEGMRIVRQFDSPWLQLYPDIGNLTERGQDTLQALELAQHHMVALHVKDTRPGEPRRVPFGEGHVPFDAAFGKLAELDYRGPLLIEMWNDNAADAFDRVKAAKRWVEAKMITAGLLK